MAAKLTRALQVRTTTAQGKKLDKLSRKSNLTESQLLRYAITLLPNPGDLDAEGIVDLIERAHGRPISEVVHSDEA